jgi:hypothetical protein
MLPDNACRSRLTKRGDGEPEIRHVLSREAARRVLDQTRPFEDSVALVFDRPNERQIVFERMDWSHPHRRGYYDKKQHPTQPKSLATRPAHVSGTDALISASSVAVSCTADQRLR